jgi:hypothetical protein
MSVLTDLTPSSSSSVAAYSRWHKGAALSAPGPASGKAGFSTEMNAA